MPGCSFTPLSSCAALAGVLVATAACHTGQVALDEDDSAGPHDPLTAIHDPRHATHARRAEPPDVTIPARTPQLSAYPCVEQCHHDREPQRTPRPLEDFHSLKQVKHGDSGMWCDFCHDLDNLDRLRLLNGGSVSFDQAPQLCGQCHGDKRRDFEAGIHGLQTGSFLGKRVRRSCTACHEPHAPKRPTFTALPPPNLRKGVP